jgi:hypothetical protein
MEASITRGLRCVLFGTLEKVTYITAQGDGGAFPECHVAQYPLDMGRKKVRFWLISSHSLLHFFHRLPQEIPSPFK